MNGLNKHYNNKFNEKKVKIYTVTMAEEDACISTSDYAWLIFINNKIYRILSVRLHKSVFVTIDYSDLLIDIKTIKKIVNSEYLKLKKQVDWIDRFMNN